MSLKSKILHNFGVLSKEERNNLALSFENCTKSSKKSLNKLINCLEKSINSSESTPTIIKQNLLTLNTQTNTSDYLNITDKYNVSMVLIKTNNNVYEDKNYNIFYTFLYVFIFCLVFIIILGCFWRFKLKKTDCLTLNPLK